MAFSDNIPSGLSTLPPEAGAGNTAMNDDGKPRGPIVPKPPPNNDGGDEHASNIGNSTTGRAMTTRPHRRDSAAPCPACIAPPRL